MNINLNEALMARIQKKMLTIHNENKIMMRNRKITETYFFDLKSSFLNLVNLIDKHIGLEESDSEESIKSDHQP